MNSSSYLYRHTRICTSDIKTSLHGWQKTHRAGIDDGFFDFEGLQLSAHVELH